MKTKACQSNIEHLQEVCSCYLSSANLKSTNELLCRIGGIIGIFLFRNFLKETSLLLNFFEYCLICWPFQDNNWA